MSPSVVAILDSVCTDSRKGHIDRPNSNADIRLISLRVPYAIYLTSQTLWDAEYPLGRRAHRVKQPAGRADAARTRLDLGPGRLSE